MEHERRGLSLKSSLVHTDYYRKLGALDPVHHLYLSPSHFNCEGNVYKLF